MAWTPNSPKNDETQQALLRLAKAAYLNQLKLNNLKNKWYYDRLFVRTASTTACLPNKDHTGIIYLYPIGLGCQFTPDNPYPKHHTLTTLTILSNPDTRHKGIRYI